MGSSRFLNSHKFWIPASLILLAVLFNWPYLISNFYADDYILVNTLAPESEGMTIWMGGWSSSGIPALGNLWWKDPDLHVSFWRPLPALLITGSVAVFGKTHVPLHAMTILIHALVAVVFFRLTLRLTKNTGFALLASLIFVTCEDHSLVVGWIATITDLMCVLFIALALLAHLRWLQRGRITDLIGSLIALVLALGCKETAMIAPFVMILMTVLFPRGDGTATIGVARTNNYQPARLQRLLSWLPPIIPLVVYLGMYKSGGQGGLNCLMYIDPFTEPLRFITHAAEQLPAMWLATLSSWPPFVGSFFPEVLPYLIVPGVLAFAAWIAVSWPLHRQAIVVWAFLAYMIGVLPQLTTDAGDRGLYFPMMPACILLAYLAQTVGPIARRLNLQPEHSNRWMRIAGWLTVWGIMVPGILVSLARPWIASETFKNVETEVRSALPHIEQHQPEHLVVLNASYMIPVFYIQEIITYCTGDSPQVWTLSATHEKTMLERTGDSSFVIRTERPGWVNNTMARYVRTEPLLEAGRIYSMPLFEATITKLTEDRTDVLAARFDFKTSFDDERVLFLRWDGETFSPLDIGALSRGEQVTLAEYKSIMEASM